MLIGHPTGGYAFLPGIEPYSSGVVATAGFGIVYCTLRKPVPYREGFSLIDRHLAGLGRPRTALCSIALRSPVPFSRQGFLDFNRGYCAILAEWGLLVEGRNPVARTNVAPVHTPPEEEVLYAFGYTQPVSRDEIPDFVIAGAGELQGGSLLQAEVVAPGDCSAAGMLRKAEYVIDVMRRRVEGLGRDCREVTRTNVYTAEPIEGIVEQLLVPALGSALIHGVHWFPSRSPIDVLEFEMDLRAVSQELLL